MQLEELFKIRQSCRNFDAERAVEREKLEKIMQLARLAPSACNFAAVFLRGGNGG